MPEQKTYTIDQAIEELRTRYGSVEQKPLLVAICSSGPDAGKTYFCSRASDVLGEEGANVVGTDHPEGGQLLEQIVGKLDYLLYTVGINSSQPDRTDIENWNRKIRPDTGRDVNVAVVIYDPDAKVQPDVTALLRDFDIVVANSKKKK